MSHPTSLAQITGIARPTDAPATLRFSGSMNGRFQSLRRQSYPGGHSRESGGTIVADAKGHLHMQSIGGLGSTSGTFSPNLTVAHAAQFTLVGIFHTHPYDRTEGSMNGVSLSGADFAHLANNGYLLSVVQSGPRLFALLRTALTPAIIPWSRNEDQNDEMQARIAAGRTFQQASRIEAQETAGQFGLAYYQGHNGVVTRV